MVSIIAWIGSFSPSWPLPCVFRYWYKLFCSLCLVRTFESDCGRISDADYTALGGTYWLLDFGTLFVGVQLQEDDLDNAFSALSIYCRASCSIPILQTWSAVRLLLNVQRSTDIWERQDTVVLRTFSGTLLDSVLLVNIEFNVDSNSLVQVFMQVEIEPIVFNCYCWYSLLM